MTSMLIPYVPLADHYDPNFDEFTYGDVKSRARKLKKDLKTGDHVFFHSTIRGRRYITAYFVVDRVLDTSEACSNRALLDKYQNPHINEYMKGERRDTDDAILFGDPILSKKLPHPLTFDQNLAEKLSLGILFVKGFTENQRIGSATRQWRTLTKKDVELILDEIKEMEKRGFAAADVILCTDEVLEIREIDVENFIVEHPHIIGSDLILKGRQRDTKSGRLDLLFEDKNNGFVVAELKLGSVGRDTIRQLRGYMHEVKSETNKEVRGAIVCKDVLPIFEKEFEKLMDIQIFQYGWKLVINPRKWE